MRRTKAILASLCLGILLAAAVWHCPSGATAQVKIQVNANGESSRDFRGQVLVLADRELARLLPESQNLLDAGRYSDAAKLLQTVLDQPEDYFYRPKDDDRSYYVGIKTEAQRMIGEFPGPARDSYDLQYGPEAQRLLDEGIAEGNSDKLATVVRRYFHTQAGYEATYLLGTYHMDHGRPLVAALCFDQLLKIPGVAESRAGMLPLKAAFCWHRAGLPSEASRVLASLAATPNVKLAGQDVKLFESTQNATNWLIDHLGEAPSHIGEAELQWAMFRGAATRNAQSLGGPPFLRAEWQVPTTKWMVPTDENPLVEKEMNVADQLQKLHATYLDADLPLLPTGQPLVINDTVVVRTYNQLRAVNLKEGEEIWRSIEADQALEHVRHNQARPVNNQVPPLTLLLQQRAWEDATFGTLSSDGNYVFCVEDLGFWGVATPNQPHPLSPKEYNRLTAYELRTGKLKWEVGGERGKYELDFAGNFFLGPPLPLAGHLYCLAEENNEIRLLVIDPEERGKLLWSQTLAEVESNVQQDPHRRQSGLSPSASDGILVCPTGAGALVTIDLTTRRLLWAYRYQDSVPTDPRSRRQAMILRQQRMRGRGVNLLNNDRWVDALPQIADGKVVFTPRDSDQIHCINLVDGKAVWKQPRGQGLYVGGIRNGKILVVGRRQISALNLADGTPAWPQPTPISIPSGQGFLSDDVYYLPLSSGEVAAIDVEQGRVLTRSKSRDGRAPGNLVSAQGIVLSQTFDSLDGFRQLGSLIDEINQGLAKNADDPSVLALRGEIRLNQGNLAEAYADLRRSLEIQDDANTRALLVESLLEGLRIDFGKHRGSVPEIEKLVEKPEQRGAFLRVLARGLQEAGESRAAFDVYMRLVALDVGEPQLERIDGAVSVRRDRWVSAQLKELYNGASADDRREMDGVIRGRLDECITAATPEGLRLFVNHFSSHPLANGARRALVDILQPEGYQLETERLLTELSRSDDPQTSGYATARSIEMLMNSDRRSLALKLLPQLKTEYAEVACLDDQTGAALAAQWEQEPGMQQAIASLNPWPVGHVEMVQKDGERTNNFQFRMPIDGSRGLLFEDLNLSMDQRKQYIIARDGTGKELWKASLNNTGAFFNPYGTQARIDGHLVLLSMGAQVIAIDGLSPPGGDAKILWKEDLVEPTPGMARNQGVNIRQVIVPGGGMRFVATDQNGQPLGSLGVARSDSICIQRGRQLLALEPSTGNPLWQRYDLVPGSTIFGDDELVFVIPPKGNDATVFRLSDGKQLGIRPVPATEERFEMFDRFILSWSKTGDKQSLKLFDVWSQKPVWSQEFSQQARATMVDQDQVAVVDSVGVFTLYQTRDGEKLIETTLDELGPINQILVLRSANEWILMAGNISQMNMQNKVYAFGYNNPVIDGRAYCFDRKTGKQRWEHKIDKQGLDLGQPQDLPILVFASRIQQQVQLPNGQITYKWDYQLECLDKRTGKIVLHARDPGSMNMIDLQADLDQKQITINVPGQKPALFELKFTDKPAPAEAAKPAAEEAK